MPVKKRTKFIELPLELWTNQLPTSPRGEQSPRDLVESKKEETVVAVKKINRPCNFGTTCKKGANCAFLHPGEIQEVQGPPRKTRMCKYGDKCVKGKNCSFAHHESELFVPECRFGFNCKKKQDGCKFNHPAPHVKGEVKKGICRFGEKCRKKTCSFIHEQPQLPEPEPEPSFEITVEGFPQMEGMGQVEESPPTLDFGKIGVEDMKDLEKKMSLAGKRFIGTTEMTVEEMVNEFGQVSLDSFESCTFTF